MITKQYYLKYFHIVLVILLSSLFFLFLYHYDNKYTQNTPQAINGSLILSEDDLTQNPSLFLINSWIYYPNQILTPKEHNNCDNPYEKKLLSIGDITQFYSDEAYSPYGCGTYVMNLYLPEAMQTYALYLPEIFSSYHIYLNDRELSDVGNPDKDFYDAKTANRIITFDYDGKQPLTLLIAVRNESHFYGGMVYPPAFGMPKAVDTQRTLSLGLNLVTSTIIFLVALLVLYFGIKMKHKNALLFTLLCVACIVFTSYELFHTGFTLSIFPWYTAELMSGYLFMLLVVMLHNRFCKMKQKINTISVSVTGCFCLIVLLYGLNAANLTPLVIEWFSGGIFIFKLLIAGYLIISSYYSIQKYESNCFPMLYASIFYACACIWDRIFPHYEPVYGSWFIEWGCLLLVVALGYMLWREMVLHYSYTLAFEEEHRRVSRQLSMQLEYSAQIRKQTEENRRIIHDFRHHLRVLTGMAEKTNQTELTTYLNNIYPNITSSQSSNIHFCENEAVDALLRYYAGSAENKNINYRFQMSIPRPLTIPDLDLCSILGNLLENAIEACEKQQKEPTSILLTTQERGQQLFLVIRNSYNGQLRKVNGNYISSKPGKIRLGIGLASSKNLVKQYGGSVNITADKNYFQVGISIPFKES